MMAFLVLGATAIAFAADPAPGTKVAGTTSFRASKLEGMPVRNPAGEKLGSVHDLVIDVANGKVAYVAMSFGGILGFGEKLFAVPFNQLKFEHGQDEMHFVIDVSKERLKNAPGFDKSNWPNFADPHWSEHIDKYYSTPETRTKETTPSTR
jgi:sporulation protein YlmC with PRC-barrel domain